MSYIAPIRDLVFAATEVADLNAVNRLPGYEDASAELLQSILEEAGKFATEVLAPINFSGDRQGVRFADGQTHTADGWREAYRKFIDGGWNGLPFDSALGGQGLPWLVSAAVAEIWHAANMSFSLCPLLTQAAIEAIDRHGSDAQKATYLPKLISGEWTGTMNLTESQSGSDLSTIKTVATPNGEHYLLSGQKIFITYGDHDLTENIIHLVLARMPDAPAGVKGISLFLAPKFLPDADGNWTVRNDIDTLALEQKLGIHASPTAALAYGSKGGAVGYLIGEAHQGLLYMFTMMNLARHSVGVEANGVAERAYQQAVAFATERVQGSVGDAAADARTTIIQHPDIKRLLWLQKSRIEAVRALALVVAAAMDHERRQLDEAARANAHDVVEIMIPIVKGYATELGLENVSLALQVHGGMGFIEETGAAQHYRDQRITPIYEGTTGIQAIDLVGRKLVRDGGRMNARVIARIRHECAELEVSDATRTMQETMDAALDTLENSSAQMLAMATKDQQLSAAVSEPYLRLWGVVACGWQMRKAAAASEARLKREDEPFYRHKIHTAQFYFRAEMPNTHTYAEIIANSASLIAAAEPALFSVYA